MYSAHLIEEEKASSFFHFKERISVIKEKWTFFFLLGKDEPIKSRESRKEEGVWINFNWMIFFFYIEQRWGKDGIRANKFMATRRAMSWKEPSLVQATMTTMETALNSSRKLKGWGRRRERGSLAKRPDGMNRRRLGERERERKHTHTRLFPLKIIFFSIQQLHQEESRAAQHHTINTDWEGEQRVNKSRGWIKGKWASFFFTVIDIDPLRCIKCATSPA